MRRLAAVAAPALLLSIAAFGCGSGTGGGPKGNVPVASTNKPQLPPPQTPARWLLHPAHGSSLRAKLDLGTATLYVGDGGERWLDKKDGTPPAPSTALLPETLVGATHAPDGKGVVLVGKSGAVYLASDPLGAPTATRPSPQPLRSIAAGKSAIVAVAEDGTMMRSADAGTSWQKITLPAGGGTLVEVAMNDAGTGIALFAPQRALVTLDDGATWTRVATPGVGARRVVLDVNGDLVLEGLEASAVLTLSPTRFERIMRAPKTEAFDLGGATSDTPLGYAMAVATGRGALVGDRYVEAIPDPDDPTRWRVAIGALGSTPTPTPKKVPELNGCTRIFVGGEAVPNGTIYAVCDGQGKKGPTAPTFGSGPMPPPSAAYPMLHVYRTDDGGATWHEDGTVGSSNVEGGHVWVAPDHSLVIDGACKKSKYGCSEGPPLVRVAGSKTFAKLGVPRGILRVQTIAFSLVAPKAFAIARGYTGPLSLLVSTDGGKDFTRVPLPSIASTDGKKNELVASRLEPGSVGVDETGVVYATAHVGSEWALFTSKDDGRTIVGKALPFKADVVSMVGKRGFAYERHGKGWETADGGVTWSEVGAPPLGETTANVACGAYGCLVGDRATRIGWGGNAGVPSGDAAGKVAPAGYATPLQCTAEGNWTPLGTILNAPSAYEAELGGVHWMAIRHDAAKGSVSVLLPRPQLGSSPEGPPPKGAKGLETREVVLFGPAGKDVATTVLPQIEGVAAIRYAFKRDKAAKPTVPGSISSNQKVDVEVAWWVASSGPNGKVHKATIHGAGPLDPRDVVPGGKDFAARAQVGMLSIAAGGVHVRPFVTKSDVPLYFVHENGKIDRLVWPDLPSKDAGGQPIAATFDALRVGDRSVVVGVASGMGIELFAAWANEAGTSWEPRTWGIWPELHGPRRDDAAWDFTYVQGKPAIVALWGGGAGVPATAWAVPIQAPDADPGEAIAIPTQRSVADPPKTCDDASGTTPRIVAPFVRGGRHPVVVQGEGADVVLATGSAVIRGAATSPCVLSYEAHAAGSSAYGAVIPVGDLGNAALFKASSTGQEIAVRAMKCTFTPGPLPASLAGTEGFE